MAIRTDSWHEQISPLHHEPVQRIERPVNGICEKYLSIFVLLSHAGNEDGKVVYNLRTPSDLQYRSRAVRAVVLLHEDHLRRFLHVWRQALATSAILPTTDDPAYAS
jgi:hypothetical protein